MDWFPLWNFLRIAAISSVIVFLAVFWPHTMPRACRGG